MIACLNLDHVGPMTVATLLRWMNSVRRIGEPDIKRVELKRLGPFQYDPTPLDTVPESELLTPGDYGCFHRDPKLSGVLAGLLTVHIGSTLADVKAT
ncbi:hypothetical protein C8Q76DRAFT_349892 [Earliella scabrosa]|nr:hypothetical protein C8Q76DRAFT_349892 [Earliella scabrosa]